MSRRTIGLGILGLLPLGAYGQDKPSTIEGWTRHEVKVNTRAMACSSDRVYIRSWYGDVAYLDEKRWHAVPHEKDAIYGDGIALGGPEEFYLFGQKPMMHWDGDDWNEIEVMDWEGPANAIAVLDSGDVVIVGYGRIGRVEGAAIKSYDADTWRELTAVAGSSLVDLWTAGEAGILMHHTMDGWTQVDSGTDATLSGLMPCGEDCLWAWDGGMGLYTSTVRHWDGSAWTEKKEGFSGSVLGLVGDPNRPWVTTTDAVYQLTEDGWAVQLKTEDMSEGYHNLTGICATEDWIAVGDGQRGVWVRDR